MVIGIETRHEKEKIYLWSDPPNLTARLFSTIRTRLAERFSGGLIGS